MLSFLFTPKLVFASIAISECVPSFSLRPPVLELVLCLSVTTLRPFGIVSPCLFEASSLSATISLRLLACLLERTRASCLHLATAALSTRTPRHMIASITIPEYDVFTQCHSLGDILCSARHHHIYGAMPSSTLNESSPARASKGHEHIGEGESPPFSLVTN